MNNKILTTMIIFLGLAVGYATLADPEIAGKGTPVITQSFASSQIRPGDAWKIYLKASDPDGKMKYIFATVSQPGVGSYPVSITGIKDENQKELSGYIYLSTAPVLSSAFFNLTLTLTVNIEDGAGQFSKPAVFPLAFEPKAKQDAPPEGVFKEQGLGPIMVTLKTAAGGSGQEK